MPWLTVVVLPLVRVQEDMLFPTQYKMFLSFFLLYTTTAFFSRKLAFKLSLSDSLSLVRHFSPGTYIEKATYFGLYGENIAPG